MTRPALLFLAQRLPYPPHRGDKIRALQIIKHFGRDYDVHVGTLIDDMADRENVDGLRPYCTSLHVEEIKKPGAFVTALPACLSGSPISFAVFQKAGLQRWVNDTCRQHKPEVAVVCSSNVADYVLKCPDKPATVIIDFADVDSEKWRNYRDSASPPKSWIYALEAKRVALAEDRITQQSSYVSFVTHEETAMFQALHPRHAAKAITVGSGVDTAYYDPALAYPRLVPDKPTFVFTGTMDYWPNEQAVEWFVQNVLKPLQAESVDAQFVIVGSRPGKTVQSLAGERGVIITGRVPDVMPYLAHADAVVCPMQIARGIQNKVLEGMAMGKPVIASLGALTGIEAIPGQHLLQADTPAEWIGTCLQLLADKNRCAELGSAARARILEEFSWTARLGMFNKLIEKAGDAS